MTLALLFGMKHVLVFKRNTLQLVHLRQNRMYYDVACRVSILEVLIVSISVMSVICVAFCFCFVLDLRIERISYWKVASNSLLG